MSTPRRITINRDHLIQMAKSIDFYREVLAFLYLKDVALASWEAAKTAKGCSKCGNEWKHMRGVCDAMLMKLREMKENNDPGLNDVRRFLSSRKGFEVGKCVLYYRRSQTQGKILKFEF